MSKLKIGVFTFTVLKQNGNRFLLQWIENSGKVKERWVLISGAKLAAINRTYKNI
jgi:hypothetical protein